MNKLSLSVILLAMFFVAACDHKEGARSPAASGLAGKNRRLSAKVINERVIEHRVDRRLELPEQSFEQRVALLNSLLEESGFPSEMVAVSIDPSMDAMLKDTLVCPEFTLDHPKISLALAVTMDRFALMYGVGDGEIRFMRKNLENIKKYPTADRPSPQGPSIDETIAILSKIEVHEVAFPQETLEARVAKLQAIADPHGLAVSVGDSVDSKMEVDWLQVPKGDLPTLLKFTCGRRKLDWRPYPGGVEFYYPLEVPGVRDSK